MVSTISLNCNKVKNRRKTGQKSSSALKLLLPEPHILLFRRNLAAVQELPEASNDGPVLLVHIEGVK